MTSLVVLVIDDNPDDRTLAVRALRTAFPDGRFVEVATAEELDRAFRVEPFDAVVTDYQLKWSDGLAVLRRLRRERPDVPVVMFTNTGSEEICAEGLREGLHDYILKKSGHYVLLPAAIRTGLAIRDARRAVLEKERALVAALAAEKDARARAEQADRQKDDFLATLSHELRTPLNAILGWAQILQRSSRDAAMVEKAAVAIERNARAQSQLVGDLLDVSLIVSGKLRVARDRVALLPVVEAAIEAVDPSCTAKRITIERRFVPDLGYVRGDASRLEQIVWNLLTNAVKFSREGGRIVVEARREGTDVFIWVIDEGEGIDAAFLPYIFERLWQQDSTTRRQGGTGLGLSIVKHLTALHGGTVRAESPGRGRGATFSVRLPLEGDPHARPSERLPLATVSLDDVEVLIVDDDPDALDVVGHILAAVGATVVRASSAQRAFALFQEKRPDVLVSDIAMPGEDGYSLLRRVRALEGDGPHVPAIAVTAFARAEDRRRAIESGFDNHLAKPVEARVLATAIAELAHRAPR